MTTATYPVPDRYLLRTLTKEIGRSTWDGLDSEVEKNGYCHIDEREMVTNKGSEIAQELERRGWKIQGTDKGASFSPPLPTDLATVGGKGMFLGTSKQAATILRFETQAAAKAHFEAMIVTDEIIWNLSNYSKEGRDKVVQAVVEGIKKYTGRK